MNVASEQLASPEVYKLVIENLEDHAIFMMDPAGSIKTWNKGAELQLGYSETEVLDKHFSLIFTGEDVRLGIPDGELRIAAKEGRCRDDRKHVRKDGVELWVNGVVTTIRSNAGELLGYSKVLNDISARVAAEDTIRHQAMHDTLTGLPNRKLMNDFLSGNLAVAEEQAHTFAILFIDMDGFKAINDTYGHEVGDILLETVGLRLATTVSRADMVARFGGDEFIVIMNGAEQAQDLAEKIALSLLPPVSVNGIDLQVTMSIGISIFPQDGATAQSLIKAADKALYRVKKQGGNGHSFYDQAA